MRNASNKVFRGKTIDRNLVNERKDSYNITPPKMGISGGEC
jgi:hypothetical protein